MLFPTSLLELTRRERTVTALFGRVHVNRFLKGNYFSGLNVINLNSPLVKLLPIITTGEVAMLSPEGSCRFSCPGASSAGAGTFPPAPQGPTVSSWKRVFRLRANLRAGARRGDTGHVLALRPDARALLSHHHSGLLHHPRRLWYR